MTRWPRAAIAVAVVLAGATGCREDTDPPPPNPDTSVTVVNLNAAMGFGLRPGDPLGTDATPEDLALLAADVLKHPADVVHLQEMAAPAARQLRALLISRTGAEWQLNWSHSTLASYYAGKAEDEPPVWQDVSAGNAQLVRIGSGVRSQRAITVDDDRPVDGQPDQGIVLPTRGRSFQGAELVTDSGVIDVYNLHLALARDFSDEERARDVRFVQEFTEARANPAIVTGDFNQVIDNSLPDLLPSDSETVAALTDFLDEHGYADLGKDLGPTSNRQPDEDVKKLVRARIDFILARGVGGRDTAKFESHESDHWGLVTTVVPGGPASRPPAPTRAPASGVPAERYRHELPFGGGTYHFFTSADGGYLCGVAENEAVCQGETKPVPPPPPSCSQDGGPSWGHGMVVAATGQVDFLCAGGLMYAPADRSPDDRDVLPPGQAFTALGFTCAAEDTGIRCTHDASGHGFAVAPDSNERF